MRPSSLAKPEPAASSGAGWFATTHWSVVLAAGESELPTAGTALEKLCQAYWKPLFVFARHLGQSEHDAQDLTQGFFEQFLQKGYIRAADPRRGRFRAFLLTSFRHFMTKEWQKTCSAKRGGRLAFISFEDLPSGERIALTQGDTRTPEAAYDRQWALRVFDLALIQLRDEFSAAGKADQFEQLKPFLSKLGEGSDYAFLAGQWDVSQGAVAVAVRRLRVRYGQLLRAEIANTVADPQDIKNELEVLRKSLIA